VKDGDSSAPNKNGTIYANNPNYAGHWLIWPSNGWLPKLVTADGMAPLTQPGAIYPGCYVRLKLDVVSHAGKSPGMYLNPLALGLVADGDRIMSEVDTSDFATVTTELPENARPVQPPVSEFAPPAAPAAAPAPVAATPVVPDPAFMAPRAPPSAPAAPRMTAKAQGASYDQMITAGWTPELLKQHGMVE
jgi:hypothetical protein